MRLLNALNSEDRGLKVRFSLAMIVFETFELILCQMLSSQGKNASSKNLSLLFSVLSNLKVRALRARNAEKVSKMSPGASGQGSPILRLQKSQGQSGRVSGESPKSLCRVFLDFFPGFWETFSGPRPEALGDIFGPGAPKRPL